MMHDMDGAAGMGALGWLWWLAIAVLFVVPFFRICARVGYPGWLSLLVLIPVANLIFLYFLAFSQWPAQRR